MADLNRDGKPDLAVANHNAGSVSVLLGTGTGSFGSNADFDTEGLPTALALADLNGDGTPDVVTPTYDHHRSVSILLGDGTGSFGPKTDFPTGLHPWAVAVADLTGDGKPDLVTANSNGITYEDTVSVLLNTAPASADLAVTLTASPDPVDMAASLTYTVTVTNNGPKGASGVALLNPLPSGVSFVSASSSQGTCSGVRTVTCGIGGLAVGGSATLTIVVTPTVAGTLGTTVTVMGNVSDAIPANDTATASVTVTCLNATLTVSVLGSASGTVLSTPSGIACPPTCAYSFASGTPITLTATPATGSLFTGWSGEGCTGTYTVDMAQDRSVTAMFLDTSPPTITHPPVTSWAVNVPLAITATISDNISVQAPTLSYRVTGASTYSSAVMAASGSTYRATIPGSAVTAAGVQYYLEARDTANAVTRAPTTAPGTPYTVVVGTTVFTDDPLGAGSTPIKAVHFTQLRTAINTLRAKYGLAAFNWSGTAPASGGAVSGTHLTDLRTALDEAYTAAARTHAAYTHPTIEARATPIKASHITELRTFVRSLE